MNSSFDLMSSALVTVPSVVANELKLTEPSLWGHIEICSDNVSALNTDRDFQSVRSNYRVMSHCILMKFEMLFYHIESLKGKFG